MKFYFLLVSCLAGLLSSRPASGQAASRDSSTVEALGQATQEYTAAMQAGSRLLNGIEYVNPAPAYVVGKPFFESDRPQRGAVAYDGSYYLRQPLLYEQVQDQLLLFDSVRSENIQLVRERVASFVLGHHQFVRLAADSASTLTAGFYEVVLDGPARLLVKRAKKVVESPSSLRITGEYLTDTRFFAQQNGHYYEVVRLKQLLSVFADKKPELQKFARSRRLKFKAASREESIVAIMRHYNELMR